MDLTTPDLSATEDRLVDRARRLLPALHDAWSAIDDAYPSDYQALNPKSEALIRCLPQLAGAHLLDIGCNSGLYSLLAADVAASVLGTDTEAPLIARARRAQALFTRAGHRVDHVRFVQGSFVDALPGAGCDAVLASLVLYHVGDEAATALAAYVRQHVRRVVIQARPQRDEAFRRHPEWGAVSRTTLHGGLYRVEDCLAFLRDCGFRHARVLHMDAHFHEHFPVVVAER